jgi:hypothetical protein
MMEENLKLQVINYSRPLLIVNKVQLMKVKIFIFSSHHFSLFIYHIKVSPTTVPCPIVSSTEISTVFTEESTPFVTTTDHSETCK